MNSSGRRADVLDVTLLCCCVMLFSEHVAVFINWWSSLSEKSLAFIGNASKPRTIALPKSAFSITRLEGSRWRLRRTRWAMEKVWECGSMWSQDEGVLTPYGLRIVFFSCLDGGEFWIFREKR